MNIIQCNRCKHWYHEHDIVKSLGNRKKMPGILCKPCWITASHEISAAHNKRRAEARKVRIQANGGSHTKADVLLQLKTQKHCCWWCGKSLEGRPYQTDHRVPVSRGGSDNPENIVVACVSCNGVKADLLPQEWNGRFL